MAKIWRVYEGKEPTRGGPLIELPLSEAVSIFEVRPEDLVTDWDTTPRFGNANKDLRHLGYRHVIVEIEPEEGRRNKWKPGFYRSPIKPKDAFRRLMEQPFFAELGAENVVRVECQPATDSRGKDALRITVVISPEALARLKGDAPLAALVHLQERLSQMGEDVTPIVEYATEAELVQDGEP